MRIGVKRRHVFFKVSCESHSQKGPPSVPLVSISHPHPLSVPPPLVIPYQGLPTPELTTDVYPGSLSNALVYLD
jgi:hypothetical protein